MIIFGVFFVISAIYWYWETQRKTFVALKVDEANSLSSTYMTALSVDEAKAKKDEAGIEVPKLAAIFVFLQRMKWAWPFIWDITRLILIPLLIQRLANFVFEK